MMKSRKKLTLAIDFDGTIVSRDWPQIGRPRVMAVPVLKMLKRRGHTLILWTCRVGEPLRDAVLFLAKNNVWVDFVNNNDPKMVHIYGTNCRKINADWCIDDRAGFLGWWSIPVIMFLLEMGII